LEHAEKNANSILSHSAYTTECTTGCRNRFPYHGFIRTDLRISFKDYRWIIARIQNVIRLTPRIDRRAGDARLLHRPPRNFSSPHFYSATADAVRL
jgi:hypothetical protein